MAEKPEVNKSQAIRDFFKGNPKAKSSEVVDALAKKGITVTVNLVTTVKSTHNKAQAAKKAAKNPATKPASASVAEATKNTAKAPEVAVIKSKINNTNGKKAAKKPVVAAASDKPATAVAKVTPDKPKVNKTQAVKDYVKLHPTAVSSEIAKALSKEGVTITEGYVANIKTKLNKGTAKKAVKKAVAAVPAAVAAAPVVVEKPAKNGEGITLAQIKKVVETIKALGGAQRVAELLEFVRELGGAKKFNDLVDAISAPVTA